MVEQIKYVGEIGVKAISEIVETKLATKANTDDVNTALSTKASVTALNALSDTVATKVDKVEGKGLSTNDFDNDYKAKLDGIDEGAEANVQGDWSENDDTKDSYIQNRTHYKNDDDTYVKLDENYIPDTIARTSTVNTKVDKVTTATSGNIVKFGDDGAIADSELAVADIATKDLLSDNVSSTNRALSAEEIDEKIQQNSAAIVGANGELSAGFQIQSSQYHSSLTTLTCLEDGPWYKSHNGEIVECGEESGVYVENNDVATVLNDETLFYFYANNNRYQRVKLGDPEHPWGKITLPSGDAAYLQIDKTTKSKPCLWFFDNTGVTEEYKGKIFMAYLDELPRKKQIVYEYDNCSTLAETEGVTPQGPYDVTFPTSIYYCVIEQTNDRTPKWILRTSIDNMALTSSQFASLNSGATKEKIDMIGLPVSEVTGHNVTITGEYEEYSAGSVDISAQGGRGGGGEITLSSPVDGDIILKTNGGSSISTIALNAAYEAGTGEVNISSGVTEGEGTETCRIDNSINIKSSNVREFTSNHMIAFNDADGVVIDGGESGVSGISNIALSAEKSDNTTTTTIAVVTNRENSVINSVFNFNIPTSNIGNSRTANFNFEGSLGDGHKLNIISGKAQGNQAGSGHITITAEPGTVAQRNASDITLNADKINLYTKSSETTHANGTEINLDADKVNITGALKGGFKALKNEGMYCTPDEFWNPLTAINCSNIEFNDDDYYETNLSYTFQGYFISSGSYSIKTTTKNNLGIIWYGDYETESSGVYEFSIRRINETNCIGIITKLEK